MSRAWRVVRERLRSLRYLLGDLAYLASRPFRGIGGRIKTAWLKLSAGNRRRIATAGGAIAIVLVVVFLVVPNLPCGAPGGDACAPPDDAIELVPADALAYVHVNLEPDSEQFEQATTLAERVPGLTSEIVGRGVLPQFLGAGGEVSNFSENIEPWFGGELALAVVEGEAGTQQVQMLEVADEPGARAYAQSISAGEPEETDYQGVSVSQDERGLATAVIDKFLVIGTAQGVRAVVDASEGSESLADDDAADEAIGELQSERFAEAYLSAEGIDSLLALSEGGLAPLEPFVDSGNSQAAAFSLSATDAGFELSARSLLDPDRTEDSGGFFAAFDPFEPQLPTELDPETLAYVGIGDAQATIDRLLDQATVRAPGIAQGAGALFERLRDEAGVDISQELLPALGGEAALALGSRPAPEPETGDAEDQVPEGLQDPGNSETLAPGQDPTPYLEFLAGEVDEEAARDAMAKLQKPLAETVDPELGSPVFREQLFDEVAAQILQRSPAEVLAYAIADSKLVVADDTAPVERLDGDPDAGLAGSEGYQAAMQDLAEEPSFVAYLDLAGLLQAAQRLGAAAGEGPLTAYASDFSQLQTFSLTVGAEDDVLSTDSRLRIAAP